MRYVIAKVMSGHWHHYVARNLWSMELDNAELFKSEQEARDNFNLMPDGDEVDAVIFPVELRIKY